MTATGPTVGLLYPGDMGCSVARTLGGRGLRVVTTLEGRSQQTRCRCEQTGITVLSNLADVVRSSAVVISLVPPAAAVDVADAYCRHAHLGPASSIYVDANSIGPELAASLAAKVAAAGRSFVDASINGLAANLTTGGTLFLSGDRAGEIGRLFEGGVRVRVLGDEPGRASAMKMLLAGVSKGISALMIELALVAGRRGMLGEMIEATASIYPEVAAIAGRMLPTYAHHAGRRATEMAELEQTVRSAGVEPCVVAAVRGLHDALAALPPGALVNGDAGETDDRSIESLIRRLNGQGVLSAAGARPVGGNTRSNQEDVWRPSLDPPISTPDPGSASG
jgi:3-hydroxyisobutyrate dehydrogenase-like beta-hydroxyacid dehydrogenase